MSQRRMFSPDIVESEEFITMPISSQALYFHLGMGADDDGFVQPKLVMRKLGANEDDIKVLLAKRFILPFESGVVVIKHWLIHNMIRGDRYKKTRFIKEYETLKIKENKAYSELIKLGCQNDNHLAPQVRLGKVRLDTVPDGTFITINSEYMPIDELTYEPLQENKGKTKYGKKIMFLLARCYLDSAGIKLEKGETYDASKISKGLSKLYKQIGDPDKTMDAIKKAGRYFGSKKLDWTPEAVWRNWEKIRQWEETNLDVSERRILC